MPRRPLPPGLYDAPLTVALERAMGELAAHDPPLRAHLAALDPHEAPATLARAIHHRMVHALASLGGKKPDDKLLAQLHLANRVLELLRREAARGGAEPDDAFAPPARRLLAVVDSAETRLGTGAPPERPAIPLSESDLLVNGRHDLSIGPEIQKELASADRVDLLCAFLKWSGLRLVRPHLEALLARRPGSLRVLTTAYLAGTERKALDELVRMGARVKVSYDTGRTRLHAKAWLFHRETGYSTACIGSSNLSVAALLDGLEWNVRLSEIDNAPILAKFRAAFEQYWDDPEFRDYDGDTYDEAVRRQRAEPTSAPLFALFDIRPRPHQQETLDDLAAERARGHHRNLVVAATGTGKTVVAALDYKRLRGSLLFVAHRREILAQSLATFRGVLGEPGFGELLHAGETPRAGEHVFASIQSLHKGRLETLAPDAYDVVIVDEFHHAAADTYSRLLEHLRPRVLLGLTATPERTDGKSVLGWFDGRIASELRLWKALDQGLLSPFQYFGVAGPDLRAVPWTRGRYDVTELRNVYTADDWFVGHVLRELRDKVADLGRMRALGFCVDVAHARFMTDRFERAGIAAACVTGETPPAERDAAFAALRDGRLRVLFGVEVFNEGVDLPDVDTLLFLRPTESALLFLQQLGRGLRRRDDKDCCTVLDFIGGAHRRFRFDARFRAILGGTRRSIERQVERGFPHLPSGCAIQLDKVAREAILQNLRASLGLGYRALAEDLRALIADRGPAVDLATFLRETDLDLEDIYAKSGRTWTALKREAGLPVPDPAPDDPQLERALARMLHLDDPERLEGFGRLLAADAPPAADPTDPLQRALFVLLGYVRRPYADMPHAWAALWRSPLRLELRELLRLLDDRTRAVTHPPPLSGIPLRVHATYTLDEILAGVDERNKHGGVKRIQTGVYHVKRLRTDLLFVTLEKSESDYSPTTLYNDYPLSDRRFHWETQSNCHEATPTGRRYLTAVRGSEQRVLLFVRQRRHDARGETMAYVHLGPAYYATHRGGRPMQIEWELEHAMPAGLYQEVKVAGG